MSNPTITAQTDPATPINLSGVGAILLMFTAKAAPGRNMGTLSLSMAWKDAFGNAMGAGGSDSTSGSPEIDAGIYLFEDPDYAPGAYTITASAQDEQGGRTEAVFVYTVIA